MQIKWATPANFPTINVVMNYFNKLWIQLCNVDCNPFIYPTSNELSIN